MTTSTDRLGTVDREGDRVSLRFTRRLRHAPDTVWTALTSSEHLRAWFPADLVGERHEGADLTVTFWPEVAERYSMLDASLPGRILTWDPPRVFEWRWDDEVLRFELHADDGGGTRLEFSNRLGAGSLETGLDKTSAGYHVCLDLLEHSLDGESTGGVLSADTAPLEKVYAERL